jgi:hypothetical protein
MSAQSVSLPEQLDEAAAMLSRLLVGAPYFEDYREGDPLPEGWEREFRAECAQQLAPDAVSTDAISLASGAYLIRTSVEQLAQMLGLEQQSSANSAQDLPAIHRSEISILRAVWETFRTIMLNEMTREAQDLGFYDAAK